MIAFMIILILAGNTAFVCPSLHSYEYSHLTIPFVSSPYCKFVLRFHRFKYTETLWANKITIRDVSFLRLCSRKDVLTA